jgi:hypothetical protein
MLPRWAFSPISSSCSTTCRTRIRNYFSAFEFQKKPSAFHLPARRNAFRHRDARRQSRPFARWKSLAETQPQLQPAFLRFVSNNPRLHSRRMAGAFHQRPFTTRAAASERFLVRQGALSRAGSLRERKAALGMEICWQIDKGTIRGRERVQHAGETDEIFEVRIGGKQNAVESPELFASLCLALR